MGNNAFFQTTDPQGLDGFEVPEVWWSRGYEYRWAFQFAGGTVADMGCGWHERPFKNALARVCEKVYAVDQNPGLLKLGPFPENLIPVISRMEEVDLPPLDKIFCISVLEEILDYGDVLAHFRKLLTSKGRVILTMDVPYDPEKPMGKYPGVDLSYFLALLPEVGLQLDGIADLSGERICNPELNLTVWHCVLKNA